MCDWEWEGAEELWADVLENLVVRGSGVGLREGERGRGREGERGRGGREGGRERGRKIEREGWTEGEE